jgi:uncharacterized protein
MPKSERYKMIFKPSAFLAAIIMSLTLHGCAAATSPTAAAKAPRAECLAGKSLETAPSGLDQVTLCIRSGKKQHRFAVEMAQTLEQQAQGLMFRTELADDKGMLFPFEQNRIASFWMKNTLIPLDIIFVGADGRIVNIAQNTTPYSRDPVQSTAPVAAVLELRGGLTKQLGIKAGDRVRWTQ